MPERRPPRPRLSQATWLAFGAYVAATLLVWSARWTWPGELAASFAWQLGLAGLAGAACAFAAAAPRVALATLALGLAHAGPEFALLIPRGEAPAAGAPSLVLASCNLSFQNEQRAELARWIDREAPDVLACYEVTPRWREVLEALRDRYPHQLFAPGADVWHGGTWGTALLSRVPFERARLLPLPGAEQRPVLEAVVRLGERALTVRAVHPMRPGRAWRTALRDEVLDFLGGLAWDGASVLAGDLNATSTSPAFARLLAATGLSDSRSGFGRQPSYTVHTRLLDLGIAIDHVLVGSGLAVLERRTSPLPGSDHRAVVVRLAAGGPG